MARPSPALPDLHKQQQWPQFRPLDTGDPEQREGRGGQELAAAKVGEIFDEQIVEAQMPATTATGLESSGRPLLLPGSSV